MAELQFEWDENKNNINIKKHGVSFEYAIRVFRDPFRLDLYDEENSHQPQRARISSGYQTYTAAAKKESSLSTI